MKIITIRNLKEAKKKIQSIGALPPGVEIMAEKTLTKVIEIKNVRSPIANILKQEMLAIGGDTAVHAKCAACQIEKSTILIIGTIRQLRRLITKLKTQVSELPKYAKELEQILKLET